MNNTAAVITEFRNRAAALLEQSWSFPVWGISEGYERAYAEQGIVYRLKDHAADLSLSGRYHRAAEWLEERAHAETLAALYPTIAVR
jgi:hypothetical protein